QNLRGDAPLQMLEALQPFYFRRVGNLAPLCFLEAGDSSWPRAETERELVLEAHRLGEFEGGLKVFLRLTGKANDDVCGDSNSRPCHPEGRKLGEVRLRRVVPSHVTQHRFAATLDWKMEVR